MGDYVEYEVQGRIGVLTLNRPEARNAVNGELAAAMEDAVDQLEADAGVWVGILTHRGPVFSAGADLKAIGAGQGANLGTKRGGFGGIVSRDREKPLIAAPDGPALAGGCEITLACDLVVASTNASFGLPEVRRNLVAAAGGLFRLPRVLPRRIALEIGITGEPITARRAYDLGLVNRLVEPGKAFEAAVELAEQIMRCAPLAVRETRRLMLTTPDLPDSEGWKLSFEAMSRMMQSDDLQEGVTAFIEKREPNWKGR